MERIVFYSTTAPIALFLIGILLTASIYHYKKYLEDKKNFYLPSYSKEPKYIWIFMFLLSAITINGYFWICYCFEKSLIQ